MFRAIWKTVIKLLADLEAFVIMMPKGLPIVCVHTDVQQVKVRLIMCAVVMVICMRTNVYFSVKHAENSVIFKWLLEKSVHNLVPQVHVMVNHR